ncbi:hypothetical protein [Tissierella sp.]|uniref:hypothetical protein n=1 Tax=Tissierella sp. TaxID=41274 RepID=UPI0028A866CD|nr:hypothetical protein [Tissierella sp.]
MAENIKEFALANIARVEIVTEEEEPRIFILTDVASNAGVTAHLSEGEEKILRVKNTIKAQNKTEDIVLGYDISLAAATFIPEILAIVDGGKWDNVSKKYTAPVVGSPVKRLPFRTNIYTEEKDADGSTISYVKFSYKNCTGKPVNYSLQDGEFYAPEFPIKSRSKLGESPIEIEVLDELPAA